MEADELFSFIKPTTVKANRRLRFQQATTGLKINPTPRDINLLFWVEMVVEKILEHFRRVCKPTSHDKIGLIIERVDYPSIPIWISLTENRLLTVNKIMEKVFYPRNSS